jgi:cob(I)alamin adenosyltransferase
LISLGEQEPVSKDIVIYLNRLSDALFVWSRWINNALNVPEHLWQASTRPPE